MESIDVVVLSSIEGISAACSEILSEKLVAIDLEGKNLGKLGDIATVTIVTEHNKAFIFDISGSSFDPFQYGLRDVLECATLYKLMFDCRQDSTALFTINNVEIVAVIDVQLMEILARSDSADESRERLHCCFHRGNVEGAPSLYTKVIKLASLSKLMSELGIGDSMLKERVARLFRNDSEFWMKRPFSSDALLYAVQDCFALFPLMNLLDEKAHTDGQRLRDLLEGDESAISRITLLQASDRYSKVLRYAAVDERYESTSTLPLGILFHVMCPGGSGYSCKCCNRMLPRGCFPNQATHQTAKRRCDNCRAIDIDFSTRASWSNRNDEGDDFCCESDSNSDGGYSSY
jgi:hypothetical protein